MAPERYQLVGQICHAALQLTPDRRAVFLDQACAGDEELRREVESLLAYQSQAADFIEEPAMDLAAKAIAQNQNNSPAGRRIGHYQILSLIGAGGMGEVYRARDTRLHREVAIKILPAAFADDVERLRRFKRESLAVSALNHPNIITIYELAESDGSHYMVTEYIEGQTLRQMMSERMELAAAIDVASQVASALNAAHAAGVIHRDIKLENIMLRRDGYVKVLDFELAKLIEPLAVEQTTGESEDLSQRNFRTDPGRMMGTPRYMSPEQALGEKITSATDIFSLGIVLYEMATGQHPFQIDSQRGVLEAIISQLPLAPSHLNPEISMSLEALILQMLEKDALLRPTAVEVAGALKEIGRQEDGIKERARNTGTSTTHHTVGREKERAELHTGFASASTGRGLLLCVSGEPGIGKTTLVEDFLNEMAASDQPCRIARGRCSERLAGAEAYLPWLEVLEGLLRRTGQVSQLPTIRLSETPKETSVAWMMRRLAPSWYVQVAPLADDSGAERALAERALSQERMKRELYALLQELSARQPLVLFFDDLHRWTLAQSVPDIERELPESVRGMIERKIAQLSEEDRKLLMAASVQGYEFDSAVVAQVLNLEAEEVEERLEKLERVHAFVRLVSEEEFPNCTLTLRYRFIHVLYQNALYGSLRATRRATTSAAVAQALLRFYGEQSGRVAAELANLFEAARDFARAAEHFLLAAQNAARVFANAEAIALSRRGLEALETLPSGAERDFQEMRLQLTLGLSLAATQGWAVPEVAKAYSRAWELCQQLDESPLLLMAFYGLITFHVVRAEFKIAKDLAEIVFRIARNSNDPSHLVMAHFALGTSLHYLGELAVSEEHFEAGISLYGPEHDQSIIFITDPGVGCAGESSRNLWLLGYPERALERTRHALTLAKYHSHPSSIAFALLLRMIVYQLRGEAKACQQQADEIISLSKEKDIADLVSWAMIWRGWALSMQEQFEEGIAQMRESLAALKAVGAELGFPVLLNLLAESLGKAGQRDDALATLDEALDLTFRNHDCAFEADSYRLRGELMLTKGNPAEAISCFQRAIEIAQRQSAKSLELRAVMCLARLWQQEGKRAEAGAMLAEIYGWFTEGFDTADLQEAKALLAELSSF